MKRRTNLYLLLMLFPLIACNGKKDGPMEQGTGSETAEVEDVVARLNRAIIDPTEEALGKITSDGLTYGHSSGKVQDRAEFMDDLVHGTFDFGSIDISDQTVHISGDVAVVRQIFDSEATNAGKPVHVHIGNVLIFQRQDGQWKLLARQAYKL